MSFKVLFCCAVAMAVAVLAGCAGVAPPASNGRSAPDRAPIPAADLAPGFEATTVEGDLVRLRDFAGERPVLLHFFAAWSEHCRQEYPHLRELHERTRERGLKVIAISADEDREDAESLSRETGAAFDLIHDPTRVLFELYEVTLLPTNVAIDRDGRLAGIGEGVDREGLEELVASVLE